MKLASIPLIIILIISAVSLPIIFHLFIASSSEKTADFYFGVSYGHQDTFEDAKLLIDKVKDYTNLFLINNWNISIDEDTLNKICDYATNSDLNFMVFFDFISNQTYTWHQTWPEMAKQRWGDKFLGIYLYEEPGGRQIEQGQWDGGPYVRSLYENVSSPKEAAEAFVKLGETQSMNVLKSNNIPVFTSDFALYWYDYQAGYDVVFVELAWNASRTQQIALNRGAANAFNKDWGAIITWTYTQPPYLADGPQILQDMKDAYNSGAKYVIVFNYGVANQTTYPEGNPYGILTEDHFTAMKNFWDYTKNVDPCLEESTCAQVALVLPQYYGGGLRKANDNVWGPLSINGSILEWRASWPEDNQTPVIWEKLNILSDLYGYKLDVVFDGYGLNCDQMYDNVYIWNEPIN